jgi:hypothetical protein
MKEIKNPVTFLDYLANHLVSERIKHLEKRDLGYCMECNAPATEDCEHH